MKSTILQAGKRYTFSDYFDFNNPTEEIVTELGYGFSLEALELPRSQAYETGKEFGFTVCSKHFSA